MANDNKEAAARKQPKIKQYTAYVPDYIYSLLFNEHILSMDEFIENVRLTYGQVFDILLNKGIYVEVMHLPMEGFGCRIEVSLSFASDPEVTGARYEFWEEAACAAIKDAAKYFNRITEESIIRNIR